MLSLISRIENVAENGRGRVTFVAGDDHETLTWSELHQEARTVAARLQARGVQPGDHVALLGPTTRQLITAIQAIWLTGGALVTMPLPMRMGALDQFIDQTRNRIRRSDSKVVVIDSQLQAFVEPEDGDPPFIGLDELFEDDGPGTDDYRRPADDPTSLAVLQFTSGSTSEPKGVMLPHQNICHNLDGAWKAAELAHDDVIVSWLPLYHDMGLVGPAHHPDDARRESGAGRAAGLPGQAVAVDALDQRVRRHRHRRPQLLLRAGRPGAAAGRRGPGPVAPAHHVERRRADRRRPPSGSSSRRGSGSGSDPAGAFPAFGMAEVCIAGCFPTPGKGLRTDWVDAAALEVEQVATPADPEADGATELALLGSPVPGLEISVIDPKTGEECGERRVGELRITGNSLTSGYYNRPEETAELIRDGWLYTGDLAYTVGGELVVCGRIKDVIIIGGRNVYPQDIEKVVGEVDGVRTGNVIAFGIDGRQGAQSIVVVAESKSTDLDDAQASHRPGGHRLRRHPAQGGRAGGAGFGAQDVVGQAAAVGVQAAVPGGRTRRRGICLTRTI